MSRSPSFVAIARFAPPVLLLLLLLTLLPAAAAGRQAPAFAAEPPSLVLAPPAPSVFTGPLAVSGNWAAVAGTAALDGPGVVFVYQRAGSGWVERAEITAPEGAATAGWGRTLALSGNTLAVATVGEVAIYAFEGRGWHLQGTLLGDPVVGFGDALALAGDILIVGEPNEGCCHLTGSAVAYTRNAAGIWGREAVFTATGSQDADWFGYAVAVAHDFAFIGAPLRQLVDVFERQTDGTWHRVNRLRGPVPSAVDASVGFGGALSASNRTVAIGGDDRAVHLFIHQDKRWVEQTAIPAPPNDSILDPSFGLGVSLSLDTLVMSAVLDDHSGAAYVYKRGQGAWNPVARLAPAGASPAHGFGFPVAASDHQALVAADGAVYVYDQVEAP